MLILDITFNARGRRLHIVIKNLGLSTDDILLGSNSLKMTKEMALSDLQILTSRALKNVLGGWW